MNWQDFGLTCPAYRISEVAELIGLSKTTLYKAIKRGDLAMHKVGHCTIILTPDILEFLQKQCSGPKPNHETVSDE